MITDKIDYKSAYESVLIANDMLRKENDRLKQEIKEIKDKLNCDLKWAFRYDELFIENKELHNKIDNAIEYINKNSVYFATREKVGNYFSNCNCDDLLEILKGDVNDKES